MKSKAADCKAKKPKRVRSERVELSSGNVFADLGFSDAEERMRKAQLAIKNSQKSTKDSN
ncbi:MAG: hypothetical protein AABN33_11370 [Acidobacteriota bacterium]